MGILKLVWCMYFHVKHHVVIATDIQVGNRYSCGKCRNQFND